MPSGQRGRQAVIRCTLGLSSLLLLWTFVSQAIARQHFVHELDRQHIEYSDLLIAPTPFNTLLWDGIAKTDSGYFMADYSLCDEDDDLDFHFTSSRFDLIPFIDHQHLVRDYLHYCDDYPLVKLDSPHRMRIYASKYGPVGFGDSLIFMFPLVLDTTRLDDDHIFIDHTRPIDISQELLGRLWRRILGHRESMDVM